MTVYKNFAKKIIKYLTTRIIHEMEQMDKSRNRIDNTKFLKFGPNSFFWGKGHMISAPDKIEIGENVHINANSYIKSEGGVKIGDNTHISRNLLLYSINHDFTGGALPYCEKMIEKPVIIGKNVWIGMNVCITPGTVIGDGAIIGMGTTVSGNVPPLSIVGSAKWRVIGKRDEEVYSNLEKLGRYGGPNGVLYVNNEICLNKLGDRKNGRRSIIEVIEYGDKIAVLKKFLNTDEGNVAFKSEKRAIELFGENPWFPKAYDVGHDFIIFEYIDNEKRLDRVIAKLEENERKQVLISIISALIDIYIKDIAHCDLHGKNIFYDKACGVKIVDFETSQVIQEQTDFLNTYDITGRGLESPANTGNMCIFSNSRSSIKSLFNLENEEIIIDIVNTILKEKLYSISETFYTRRYKDKDRHTLRNRLIYNTFDLKYLSVSADIGQRNIKKRLKRFGITKDLVQNKSVLDIGCNIGGLLFELQKMSPRNLVGLEFDKEKVTICHVIAKLHNITSIQFEQKDVESKLFYDHFNEVYDIVFCLAVIEHLNNKEIFIKKLFELCKDKLFLEGNSGTNVEQLTTLLIKNGFIRVEYIGLSNDEKNIANNNRPLFIASKS